MTETQYNYRPPAANPLEAPVKSGSAVLGILGALLGALVGAVPWFFASTFAGFFVGWLGFLVGWLACVGYRRLGGLKATRFATAVVVLSSVLALLLAEGCSWMYLLCSDPSWQIDAEYMGISVQRLAFESLLMPENWPQILPSLGVGMVIGLLGVYSARPHLMAYTDPDRAARTVPGANRFQSADAAVPEGFAIPSAFTVRDYKGVRILLKVLGWTVTIFFVGLLALVALGTVVGEDNDWDTWLAALLVSLPLIFLGVFLLQHARRKIEVEGETLSYLPTFGAPRTFCRSDISGMKLSPNGRRLCGRDGKVLARFETNQENSAVLLQYLRNGGVGLTA